MKDQAMNGAGRSQNIGNASGSTMSGLVAPAKNCQATRKTRNKNKGNYTFYAFYTKKNTPVLFQPQPGKSSVSPSAPMEAVTP
jgi:hypothetical protein